MLMTQSYQKLDQPQYVEALVFCQKRKVCTNLAKELNESHDSLYYEFKKASDKPEETIANLECIAQDVLDLQNSFLIFDDSQLSKMYAQNMEGLETGYDGSTHRPCLGIKMLNMMLADKDFKISINAVPFVSKALAGDDCKSKSQIAVELADDLRKRIPFHRMLADAHFSTKDSIKSLSLLKISYLMKISNNKKVSIKEDYGQLKKIFRLKRNQRVASVKGYFDGIECYFYAVKIENGSTIYLISNDSIDPYKAIGIYRIRWNIELFHRTAKQYLGLKDCQMLSIEKQRQHALYVMQAYNLSVIEAKKLKLECVEDYINLVRDSKHNISRYSKRRSRENFLRIA
jgi:hypothetical protein